jgi:hypothetical protein
MLRQNLSVFYKTDGKVQWVFGGLYLSSVGDESSIMDGRRVKAEKQDAKLGTIFMITQVRRRVKHFFRLFCFSSRKIPLFDEWFVSHRAIWAVKIVQPQEFL